ncbi:hypothetical protein [Bacillus sp. FJAT-47783]|uniref:hypothetical protein n=1 Tax=Bacillus sp. FJAT-47783 TaxID=2922712 RepID=UPI001FAB5074|nr:hypothetical protein [Bacillus sp. FJAT-47783]
MGYIAPIPNLQYTDYHIRMVKDKFDYVQYFPIQKVYNEKRAAEEFERFQVKTRQNHPIRKLHIKKGMYVDMYV